MTSAPSSLFDLQVWFGQMVTRPLRESEEFRLPHYDAIIVREIEQRICPGPKLSAAQRIGLYNQQYWWRLFALLQDKYPGLLRLFGYKDFNDLIVEPYLLKYYPNHWSLRLIGRRLPQWIEESYYEEDRLLVLQIAQIEEAHERLLDAPSLPPLQSGEELGSLFLQPSLAVFALDADLFSFRKQLIAQKPKYWEENDFPTIDWSDAKRYFTLHREKDELFYEEIVLSQYLLLQAFAAGATLAEACSRLCLEPLSLEKVDNDEVAPHIATWLKEWVLRGWLTTHHKSENRASGQVKRCAIN